MKLGLLCKSCVKISLFLCSQNAVGVPAEFAETPPPTNCHLSIKVTTSTRNIDATSESFLLLIQLLARRLTQLLAWRLAQLTG